MKRKMIKKKKRKGFTLIELLAVILILGIIALIAIPTVSSVVEQSRKGAAESSASQFVTSVGELVMTTELSGNKLSDGIYSSEELKEMGLNIKGTLPDSGVVKIESGEVVSINLTYGNYVVTSNDGEYTVSSVNDSLVLSIKEDINSNKEPDLGDKVCIDTECFYVLEYNNGNVRMLAEWNLDVGYDLTSGDYGYNIPGTVIGSSETYNANYKAYFYKNATYTFVSPKDDLIRQNKDRFGSSQDSDNIWIRKGVINFYDIPKEKFDANQKNGYWGSTVGYVYNENSTIYKYVEAYVNNLKMLSGYTNITGSLITYEDIIDVFKCTGGYNCSASPYSWVYQTSYWTGSSYSKSTIWYVDTHGVYGAATGSRATNLGVRPVITVPKSIIN